jgi:hypothetical protein
MFVIHKVNGLTSLHYFCLFIFIHVSTVQRHHQEPYVSLGNICALYRSYVQICYNAEVYKT